MQQDGVESLQSDRESLKRKLSLITIGNIIIFFTLGIKDPEGFGKKLEEMCRSDHYSGQSSNTKESCSSTLLHVIIIIIITDNSR